MKRTGTGLMIPGVAAFRYSFFLFLFLIASQAKAQVIVALLFGEKLNSGKLEFGLTVGPIWTNITNTEGQARSALSLGMFFNIHPEKRLFIHAELTPKNSLGAENLTPYSIGSDSLDYFFSTGKIERKIKAMGITILGRYAVSQHFFIDGGIQPDLLYKPKDIFRTTFNDNDLEYTLDIEERITRLNFNLTTGLFYKFKPTRTSMGIGVRYIQGVTDIDKMASGSQYNRTWTASITIPIGAAPKANDTK